MVSKGVFTNVKTEKNHCHVKFDSKLLVEIHYPYFLLSRYYIMRFATGFKFHTEESMVHQNSVNAQPRSKRAVIFSIGSGIQ